MSTLLEHQAPPRLRPDIVVMRDGDAGRGRIAKDPRRRKYFRFDDVEAFILDRLDGQHSALDIQVELASHLGEEFALDEVNEFIDSLREKGLLEGGGPLLPVKAPQLGRQVIEALEQGGLKLRTANDPLPPGLVVARHHRDEAHKFDEALQALREGRFQSALRSFDDLLAANPENRRAAAIRALLIRAGEVEANKRAAVETTPTRNKSLLYYQIPALNPDRFFGAVEPLIRFVWTPGFLLFYAAIVGLAAWTLMSNGAQLFASLPRLGASGWGLGLFLTAVSLVVVHECCHGLTCKHFGGRVPEAGFLMVFFCLPAFYVDVSDAWLFRDRRHRLLTGLAGPMWDLASASLGVLVWASSPVGPIQAGGAIIFTVASASLLMNLNPLIKLDGYYALSDLSGIPNLKDVAGRVLVDRVRLWRGLQPLELLPPPRTMALLAAYGFVSLIYSFFILWALLWFTVTIASQHLGLLGPTLIVGLLAYTLRKPLALIGKALLAKISVATPRKAFATAALLLVIGAILVLPRPLKIAGPVTLDAATRLPLRAEVAGNVAQLMVKEGDQVVAGQPVARLDSSELETRLAMARSSVAQARASLALLERGAEPEQIHQAHETVQAARAEVSQLESRVDRLAKLRKDGLVSADLYEQTNKDLTVQRGALRSAIEEARLLERGAAPERLAVAQAEVQRLEADQNDLERRVAACLLKAPAAGKVIAPKLDALLGTYLAAGGALLEVADTSHLVADVDVLESEIGEVHAGETITVRWSAFPDRSFNGTVLEIAPAAATDRIGRAMFKVRCSIADPDNALRPGMTGAAKIEAGKRPLVSLIGRRILRMIDPSLL